MGMAICSPHPQVLSRWAFRKVELSGRCGDGDAFSRRRVRSNRRGTSSLYAARDAERVTVWGGMEIPKPLLTTYIPCVLVLAILMYLDAAYSGDWSRIGVLTKEQEKFLQDFCVVGVAIHAMLGVAAAKISKERGERTWVMRGLKTFVVGVVSFTEVYHLHEDA